MQEDPLNDFSGFKTKLDSFIVSTHFHSKRKEYEEMLQQIASISLEDMKEEIRESADFKLALTQSHTLMERIVSVYQELNTIFTMDEEALKEFSGGDLSMIEKNVSTYLAEAANLVHQFDLASAKARKIIEVIEDPFIYQGM